MKSKGDPNNPDEPPKGGIYMAQCNNRSFIPIPNTSIFSDYQEIKVQELFKTLKPGNIPRSILVLLEDNLVDICKPGDDVLINGILIQRWKNYGRDERPIIDIAILANNIIVLNKKEFIQKFDVTQENKQEFKKFWKEHSMLDARNKLIESICPYIYEKNEQKMGMLLAIIGGVPKLMEQDNTKIRGQIHMLMVGEPGTGKSCLL
jgi:DNA helicase MCM9